MSKLSRRELLVGAGKVAAGAAVLSVGGAALFSPEAEARKGGFKPWPYKKIDPRKAADIAYNSWYRNFCGYGSAAGIIVPLRKSVGGPYKTFPLIVTKFGEGGVEGWGTLCGTLLGAGVAISLIAPHKDAKRMINDLMNYYSVTMMPTYTPAKPRATFKNKTVSESPLCHISVGKWMKAEGVKLGSPQRRDRCARLTASIAYKTVEMLNALHDGTYKPAYTAKQTANGITTQNNCTECHGDNVPMPKM